MKPFRAAGIAIVGLLAPMALAAAPASTPVVAPLPASEITTIAQASDDILAQLPTNAFEAGLDYAPMLVSVNAPTRADRNVIASSGLDVTEHAGDDFVEVVINSAAEEAALAALGYTWDVVTADMITLEYERIMADAEFYRLNVTSALPSGRTTYRQLADFGAEIDQLVADNATIAKRISVGESIEGRDLTGIEIGVGVNDPEDGRPVLLMFGNHHAREWPSAETPMEFAYELIQDFNAGDVRTIDLLRRARVIIVPVSNPDGFNASRVTGDVVDFNTLDGGGTVSILTTPGNAYKRKNCNYYAGQGDPSQAGCVATSSPGGYGIGVDLNRNYGGLWGGPGADGDPNTASPIYRGPAPFSEPETQAIRTLISTRQVTTLISNHTFSNLLLRPVGVEPSTIGPDGLPVGFAPDECFTQSNGIDNGMQALGERMTAQTGYSNQFGWELYDTTGTTEDYSYNATGGYGYTFEIGPDEFHPPFENVINEYTGETASAQAMTFDNYGALTTSVGQNCAEQAAPATVGGGLSEAYYIALENAADSATHSLLTGFAPEGAEIAVTRTGTFPLWDGTPFEDTVATKMTVVGTDGFAYHVNPSTRPFVASRPYTEGGTGVGPTVNVTSDESSSGATSFPPGASSQDIPIDVPAGIDSLEVYLTSDLPADDYDVELLSPTLTVLDSSGAANTDEYVSHQVVTGIQPGGYALRIINFAAAGPWNMRVVMGTIDDANAAPDLLFSPASVESWTVTCSIDGEVVATRDVTVERGDSRDLGTFCGTAPAPAPVEEPAAAPAAEPLPTTGGGAALAALFALGSAAALKRRRA